MSDLIDRQAAIDAPVKMVSEGIEWIPVYHLKDLPSAQPEPCADTISRKAAIDAILAVTGNSSVRELYEHVQEHGLSDMWSGGVNAAIDIIIAVPSAQPEKRTEERTETHSCDCISRKAAIDALDKRFDSIPMEQTTEILLLRKDLRELPSAQPEPLSDAYIKAVWTWLLNYQIKAAELQGRYTPYEVLSWVANDWRKEHE